jgi:membrane peptidoglycan carboxypeptidase
MRYYPFVLGAQPVRPIDLAGFYAAIANEGKRPTPHVIESITQDGREVYKAKEDLQPLPVDPATVFQLRTILQGVVARGTAARLSAWSSALGGKTGTSDDFNDAWFAGFTNDVTVVVWVGYDNAKGKRTLGQGQAGSKVAVPVFEPIMRAVWAQYAPQTPLRGPSPEAAKHLVSLPIDLNSGQRLDGGRRYDNSYYGDNSGGSSRTFMEYFRLDDSGHLIAEDQYMLSSRSYGGDQNGPFSGPFPFFQSWFSGGGRDYDGSPRYVAPPSSNYSRGPGTYYSRDYEGRPVYIRPPNSSDEGVPQPQYRTRRPDAGAYWRGRPVN